MTEQYADQAHRYRLDSRIATGGMGVVWRATDIRLHREVAVKVLKEEYADDPTFRARFDTEARNAASLHHPNIAGIFDYDANPADGRAPFLVMELVDGKPLSTLLSEARAENRRIDADVVRDLLAQAADGLAVAHRAGIVHRDVKPANLVVTADREVKVTDFGIARAADSAQITRTGAVMGTPQYLSPEQAHGEVATSASDVYSLGVVAYEALTGIRPFEAESPVATILAHVRAPVPEMPDHVPAGLGAVVQRALAKDPAERYPDAGAFAAALRDPDAAAAAAPATAVMPATPAAPVDRLTPATSYAGSGPVVEPAETPRKRPGAVWLVILLVLLLVAAILLIGWLLLDRDAGEEPADVPVTSPTTSETTSPTPTQPTETGPETIDLVADDYVGRDLTAVESELRQLGFEIAFKELSNDGSQTENTVEGINPHGTVEEGSVITISYYGAPPAESPTDEPTTETTTDGTPDIGLPTEGDNG